MRTKLLAGVAALAIAVSSVVAISPAQARWHGHHGGWGAPIAGFAAGAILGGLLASAPPPAYYAPGYYDEPGYPPGDAVAWCAQHYRSYDPASGTFLGYDGYRHPCP